MSDVDYEAEAERFAGHLGGRQHDVPDAVWEERDNLTYVQDARHWDMESMLDASNADALRETLLAHKRDVVIANDGALLVRVRRDGSPTDGFRALCDCRAALERYPVLDDEDYSRRQYEQELENISQEARDVRDNEPADWKDRVHEWLRRNNVHANDGDDGCRYWSREDVTRALMATNLHEKSVPDQKIERRMRHRDFKRGMRLDAEIEKLYDKIEWVD